jgi:hypothetical protein
MKKPEYLLICTLFASFLLAPALARVAGIRAEAFENRALAERPRAGWASAFDTGYYAGVSAWMEDHLSLRQMAVSTDARLDLNLFRDSPDPQVWLGRNDWLYYDAGLRRACTGDTAPAALLESISRLETMLGESGRTLRWMIVPNKIAIYPEHATPGILRAASCGEARRGELYDALQNSPPSGFIDLHRVFKTAKEQFSRQLYFPDDSHVTPLGSALIIQQIVGALRPGLWDPRAMHRGQPLPRVGDLAQMLVIRDPIAGETWGISRPDLRPGVTESSEITPGFSRRRLTTVGPDETLITEPTFVIHDSQFNTAMTMMRSYFADITLVKWNDFDAHYVAAEMAAAQIVLIEVVERSFYWRVEQQLGSPELLRALKTALEGGQG